MKRVQPTSRRSSRVRASGRRPGTATKISVTIEATVLREVQALVRRSRSSLSAHVTEALARDLRRRRLQEVIAEFESEHGEITEAELAEVRAQWQA